MTDFALKPRTAFGLENARAVTHGAATLTERPEIAIASVTARADQGDAVAAVITARCGAPCPVAGYVTGEAFNAFWTGPEQWFVMADHEQHELPATDLKGELGPKASVTDQSDGWVVFDLQGPALTPILEKLANIDLAAFTTGRAQRTVIEHVSCFVLCDAPGQSYRLLCGRSFASSFVHAVETAMKAANR